MTILQHGIAQAAAGGGGYQIARSLRFNSADSAYLSRTPASAGSKTTWTFSSWIKRSSLTGSGDSGIFAAMAMPTQNRLHFTNSDKITFIAYVGGSFLFQLTTTQVFRDLGAWFHLVAVVDSTNATASERIRLYVNGSRITALDTATYPSQNADCSWNGTQTHEIGSYTVSSYSNAYFAETRFVDGQALEPTSFGEFDANTGVWSPKTYTGTYGTNGFYLPFSDNTGADSFGIGTDFSASALNRVELGNTSVGYSVLGTMTYGVGAAAVNLRDNNATTAAADPNGINVNTAMGYDFGRAIKIRKITTLTALTNGVSFNLVFNIQYSDDNSTWTTITGSTTTHTISSGLGVTNTTSFDDNGSHRYWRLRYLSGTTGGNCWIATLDMFVNSIGPNSWYPVNFSVTAGVGNDSLVDSPTNYGTDTGAGGEVRGNYATVNSLMKGSNVTIANGNLDINSNTNWQTVYGTIALPTTGKWYWEVVAGGTATNPGIASLSSNLMGNINTYPADTIISYTYYASSGNKITGPGNSSTAYGSTFTTGDVIGIAFDADNGKLWFAKNGTWQASGSPTGGTNAAFTGLTAQYIPCFGVYDSGVQSINFGQRPFAYTAPSGFKALCTQNLPTPAIGATSSTLASKNMNIALYTGNGSTQSITGLGLSPDLVWYKDRSAASSNGLFDRVRGATAYLSSDNTGVESTVSGVTSFDSDGFSLGSNAGGNFSGRSYVGWTWKGGGTGVSNTSGSITSTVSANATAGISIVGYTGNNTAGATVGHGLGVAPKMIIVKSRGTENWGVYHHTLGSTTGLLLNTTGASISAAWWNSAAPTSSTFSLSSGSGITNTNAQAYIAYCFAEVAGFSKFGSYTGNGSTDGTFVYTGFRPRFIIIKNSGAVDSWQIRDTARDSYNQATAALYPNLSNAEGADTGIDILSNGFKLRASTGLNANTNTFVYAAFAEAPFQYSRAR